MITVYFIYKLSFSQNNAHLDSILNLKHSTPKKKKLEVILDIPQDYAISNTNTYETLVDKAINISTELNDSLSLADSYLKKALALHYTTKDEEALSFSIKAITIYEKLNQNNKAGNAYCKLAWKLKNRDSKKAINYMLKGIDLLEKTNSLFELSGGYDNYGVLLGYEKKWDSAIYYHHKSLTIKKQLNDSVGIPFSFSHIANVHLQSKKYDISLKYLDSSFSIRKKRNDIYGITDSYLYYGDLFFAKKDYKNAIYNFKKGYDLSLKNKYTPLKKYAAEYLFKSYNAINSYENALYYNLIFNNLKDSIINQKTNTKIAELEIEYQTANKEKEILKQKEQLLASEVKIKNQNFYTLLLGAGILILGIVSYGTLKYQKNKRKQLRKQLDLKEKLATAETENKLQKQRLRISRDLHDNIGSQLTFIISSIDNVNLTLKTDDNKLKNRLNNINDFASSTISQLRDTIWAMNKDKITLKEFHSRVLSFIEKAKSIKKGTSFDLDNTINRDLTLSSANGINIFRIVQESINNAIKYAEASIIKVTINETVNNLEFIVSDNGKGFDINSVELGHGLENMQKRVEEIKGELDINSKPQKGTTIKVTLNKNTKNYV